MARNRITDIITKKENGEKISMLTAYDYYSARLVDEAGIDMILVGDSLGMVIQGREDTLAVNLDEMIYHTKMVIRGSSRSLVVTDLPFMSFQTGVEDALRNAGRILKETGAGAVKLEGGKRVVPQVRAMVEAGIPVMGHLGLTPQSVHQFGGFRVQGREKDNALKLLEDAMALEEAGVFSIVLETVPMELANILTEKLRVPTIGIGAGPYCDGQVLVYHDLLGFDPAFKPKFARRYLELHEIIGKAIKRYKEDIIKNDFPREAESFHMEERVLQKIREEAGE